MSNFKLPDPLKLRLPGFYGRQLDKLLALIEEPPLSYVEYAHFMGRGPLCGSYEQAIHLDDLLLRRTRLGLILPQGAIIEPDESI